jgi:alkylation response protein AidB-like acyl-CoA dehydrogenase
MWRERAAGDVGSGLEVLYIFEGTHQIQLLIIARQLLKTTSSELR